MSFTEDQIKVLTKARNDFPYFVSHIFSKCFKRYQYIGGEFVDSTARFLSSNQSTMRISARGYMKSTSLYAYFMWKLLFEGASNHVEAHYFSYQQLMAGYHVKKIKQHILTNPYYSDLIDKKPTAEATLKLSWDNVHYTTLLPHGLCQFKRGVHGDLIFVDDPFQDPENVLSPTNIYKINEIFVSNILDMPKMPNGELHVVGTAQTNEDFFFDKNITRRFAVRTIPAIQEGKAVWPEYMTLEELRQRKRERGSRIFDREYLCTPAYSSESFFDKQYLKDKIVNSSLSNLKLPATYDIKNPVVAGFDIGKKRHPSHLSVFEKRGDCWVMIHHIFMDGWSYSNGARFVRIKPTQVEYLQMAIDDLKIDKLYFDNTRGEFEPFLEQKLLPPQMIPVVMTRKTNFQHSAAFDRAVEKEEIMLIDNERLIDQICAVTNDLHAVETKDGHGDSFWSIALAISGFPAFILRQSSNAPTTGGASLFAPNSAVPRGW